MFRPLFERELKAILKNPAFLISILIIPAFYAGLGGAIRYGASEAARHAESLAAGPAGVVVEDSSGLAREFVLYLNQTMGGKLAEFGSAGEALSRLDVAVVVPPGFARELEANGTARLLVYSRVPQLSFAAAVPPTGFLEPAAREALALALSGGSASVARALNATISLEGFAVIGNRTLSYDEVSGALGAAAVGSLAVGMLVAVNLGYAAQASAMEKEEKAFEMLLAQPIKRRNVVLAKVAASVAASLVVGAAYGAGLLLMFSLAAPPAPARQAPAPALHIGGEFAASLAASAALGLLVSGALGVLVGGVVSDARSAGIISMPAVLLFLGLSLVAQFVGLPSTPLAAAAAGLAVVLTPYVAASAQLTGQPELLAASVLSSVALATCLLAASFYVYETEVVVTGIRLRAGRRVGA